jgi:hypothetical protein
MTQQLAKDLHAIFVRDLEFLKRKLSEANSHSQRAVYLDAINTTRDSIEILREIRNPSSFVKI